MDQTLPTKTIGHVTDLRNRRVRLLGLAAVVLICTGVLMPTGLPRLVLLAVGATLVAVALATALKLRREMLGKADHCALVAQFVENDCAASFVVRKDGLILSRNEAATEEFGDSDATTLAGVLASKLANPAGILFRLLTRAEADGAAREDLVTRAGHLRLSVNQIEDDLLVWRCETLAERQAPRGVNENAQLPMIMVGRTGAVLFMNDAARSLVGHRVKSLEQLFIALPLVPGTVTELSCADSTEDVLIAEVPAGVGRRAIYLLPPPDTHGREQGWQVFQDLPVPLVKVAPDGKVLSFNRMASRLIGPTLAEGSELASLMEGLGRSISDWLRDTMAGRLAQKSEFLRLTRTDRETFVQVTLNRISEDGESSLIAVLSDATELKSLEAQFVQSQKMQAIGQLAGGVAHDFNNLLTAISGHCDLLLLRHDQGDPDYSDLVQINQNANRAAALVGQLLAFSRKQTLRPETLDMRDTLSDLTHLLNRLVGEKVTLTLSHDPVLQPIRADKRQLEQVLMNLVVNARDAMPGGGEIRIVTECCNLKEPMTRDRVTVPPGQYVTVQVSDDGAGIPPDKLQKVFEPFFTTKRTGEGTGLGLSTAYGIIKQSGGYIFVDSTVNVGTSFILYFPVMEVQDAPVIEVATKAPRPTTKHCDGVILLVEDEAPVRAFASRALRMRGYTVLEADSAEAALRTLEDDSLNIDVFVTDVVMPGMDGPSWVREALKERPGVRVVFVSGYAEDSFGEAQMKIPNSVFLPKPFSLNDLTETVQNQLH